MKTGNISTGAELLEFISSQPADHPAISFYGPQGPRRLSYGVVRSLALNAMCALDAVRGEGGGPVVFRHSLRIGLLLRNRPEIPAIVVACLARGDTLIPLNPDSHPIELQFIVADADLDLIVTDDSCSAALDEMQRLPRRVSIERLVCEPGIGGSHATSSNEHQPALILYTSGTTSRPKGVMLSGTSVLTNASWIASHFSLDRSTQLTTLPLYHAHAFQFGMLSSLVTGGHLVILHRFDTEAWPRVIRAERVSWTSIVPGLLPSLVYCDVDQRSCPHLQGILISSAPLNEVLAARFEQQSGIPLIQGWGQTEYTCWATVCDPRRSKRQCDGTLRSVGTALPGAEIRVITSDGSEASEGQTGELVLSGVCTMLGYYKRPDLTGATLTGNQLRTGDEGYFKSIDGQVCYFVTGRIKEMINRGGEKVSPLAIEEYIYSAFPDSVGHIAVLGYEHFLTGEEIGLYIHQRVFDNEKCPKVRFLELIQTMHSAYRPRVVIISGEPIPKTFTGKTQRGKLKDYFKEYYKTNRQFLLVETTQTRTAP